MAARELTVVSAVIALGCGMALVCDECATDHGAAESQDQSETGILCLPTAGAKEHEEFDDRANAGRSADSVSAQTR